MSVAKCLGVDDLDGPNMNEARSHWPQWCEEEPALAIVDDLKDLPHWMRQAEPAERDAVVSALLRLGATDRRASMVLAWLLVPGASLLAGRLRNLADVIDEVVAGQLWIQISEHLSLAQRLPETRRRIGDWRVGPGFRRDAPNERLSSCVVGVARRPTRVVGREVGERARAEPPWELTGEPARANQFDKAFPDRGAVGQPLQVQVDQSHRVRSTHQVLGVAVGARAQLRTRALQDEPIFLRGSVAQREPDDRGLLRELVEVDQLQGGPEHVAGIHVMRLDLEPPGTPLAHGIHDRLQRQAHLGQLIRRTASRGIRDPHQYPMPLQRVEPLSQQRGGDSGRALPDLVEGAAAVQQIADDDRRPALREQFGAPGDRAKLTVVAHVLNVAQVRTGGNFRF